MTDICVSYLIKNDCVFRNLGIVSAIENVENGIRNFGLMTIEESLLIGTSMNYERVVSTMSRKQELLNVLHENPSAQESVTDHWTKFGIYNHIEIMCMDTRATFVSDLKTNYPKLAKYLSTHMDSLPGHVLREISTLAYNYPNIVWSLKLLALRMQEVPDMILPNTSPCQRASEVLFGESYKSDQIGHTMLCHRIASATGLTPMNVNTALYVIGQRINGDNSF